MRFEHEAVGTRHDDVNRGASINRYPINNTLLHVGVNRRVDSMGVPGIRDVQSDIYASIGRLLRVVVGLLKIMFATIYSLNYQEWLDEHFFYSNLL